MKNLFLVLLLLLSGSYVWSQESAESAKQVIQLKNGATYTISTQPLSEEQQGLFDSLSDENKELFLAKRERLLQRTAFVLNKSRFVIGTGSLVKNQYRFVCRAFGSKNPAHEKCTLAYGEQMHEAAQAMLNAIDYEVWQASPLVAKSSEFGMFFALNGSGGAAFLDKGAYYGLGMGVAIGFDHATDSFVFEIFQTTDFLKRAYPVVAQVAGVGQAMGYTATSERPTLNVGKFITPPGPVATVLNPSMFAFGMNQGLGFPPLDTFYAYETRNYRLSLLRVSVSFVAGKRGVRIKSGFDQFVTLAKGARATAKASCEALLGFISPQGYRG